MSLKTSHTPSGSALLVAIGAFWLLAGCNDSQEAMVGPPSGNDQFAAEAHRSHSLDVRLRSLLITKSEDHSLEFFLLPKSTHLRDIPQDPKNPLTPPKIHLGKLLYHETALAIDNVRPEGREAYSCASCHHAQGGFAANLPQGIAEGGIGFGALGEGRSFDPAYDSGPNAPDCQPIRTPTSLNTAYQELMLWNGQFGGVGDNLATEGRWTEGTPLESNFLGMHGLETQAHAGLEVHRMGGIELSRVSKIPQYKGRFRSAFPGDPQPINWLNAALAIAAYERSLLANKAPFQRWLRGNKRAMTSQQKRGALVFFGDAGCANCHTGPALNSMTFHALGMNDLDGGWEIARVNLDPFGGSVPDNTRRGRGGFTGRAEDDYKFKTPQLYNLIDSPYYGHGGSFSSLQEVVVYMNAGLAENAAVPESQLAEEFHALGLSERDIHDLVAFLESGLYDADLARYVPRRLPSGNCFPVNDEQARSDLGCDTRGHRPAPGP